MRILARATRDADPSSSLETDDAALGPPFKAPIVTWQTWACAAELPACPHPGQRLAGSSADDRGRFAFGSLRVLDDATLTVAGGVRSVLASELDVLHSAAVTVQGPETGQLRIEARDALRLGPGAAIRADGAGYGPDARHPSCSDGGARNGGLHGGGPAGQSCGDYEWPVLAGPGGSSGQHAGGAGGGSVTLVCNATESSVMELNGTVSVDGQSGRAYTSGSGSASGGGAGGSLLVVASRLSGTGTLSADGGAGADGYGSDDSNGGSGGRIAIHAHETSRGVSFTGAVRARAGAAYGSWGAQAAAGTVYWCDGRASESEAALEGEANVHRCGVRRLELDNSDRVLTPYFTQLQLPAWRRLVEVDELHLGSGVQLAVPGPPVFDPVAMPLNRTAVVLGNVTGVGSGTSALHALAGTTVSLAGLRPGVRRVSENGEWVRQSQEQRVVSMTVEEHARLVLPQSLILRSVALTVRGDVFGARSLWMHEGSSSELGSSGAMRILARATRDADPSSSLETDDAALGPPFKAPIVTWQTWACAAELPACPHPGQRLAGSSADDRGRFAFGSLRVLDDATLTVAGGVRSVACGRAGRAAQRRSDSAGTGDGPAPHRGPRRAQARPGRRHPRRRRGYGPDARHPSCSDGGARNGGLHGGGPAGKSCGDYEWPVLAGPGGSSGQHAGGAGGGSVTLVCNATESSVMELNGTVSVDGQSGRAYTSEYAPASGGGAGGSLLVVASRLSGTGTLSADGGAGADGHGSDDSNGGSGGRIAIHAHETSRGVSFTGAVRARAGAAYGSWGAQAAAGTVYWCDGRASESEAALEGEANVHRCGVRRLELDNSDRVRTPYFTQLQLQQWRRLVEVDELHLGSGVQLAVPGPPVFDPVAMPLNRTAVVLGNVTGVGSGTSALHALAGTTVSLAGLRPGVRRVSENGEWVRQSQEQRVVSMTVEEHARLVLPQSLILRSVALTVRGDVFGARSLWMHEGSSSELGSSGAMRILARGDARRRPQQFAGNGRRRFGAPFKAPIVTWQTWACAAELPACPHPGQRLAGSSADDRGRFAFGSLRVLWMTPRSQSPEGWRSVLASELDVLHSAAVTVQGPETGQLRIEARDALRLGPGAAIRADGAGYGPDARHPSCSDGGARNGGLHGGGPAGQSCGDYEWPVLAGPGGSSGQHAGGAGGGSVTLVCNATESSVMELNGTVSVDGQSGRAYTSSYSPASGGGAGGSLLVVASRLSGTGTLSADGGAGADGYGTLDSNGGSGGRIAIHAHETSRGVSFTGAVRARAGAAYGSWGAQAAAGTVYWCDGRASESEAALEGEANVHRCGCAVWSWTTRIGS
ncbi:hypothetical protein FNF28_06572 [Cafeteria roenbergensis]|uniref:G8 domain-containing protein n=2 Tax=Cafeteria roenbergensis TaxID=33653 RepID=A0A5A8CWP8_CAFRO|nr:hypothetical protein FNF28_06572 [Cafeteria roenbergensis]